MRSLPGRLVLAIPLLSLGLAACNGSNDGNGNGMPGGGNPNQSTAAGQSTNWSGYVREGSGLNRVSGSWIVPRVTCGGSDGSASSTWTGIGGFASTDPSLIQAGTSQDCSGGASYYAWWETIPAPAVNADGPLSTQSYPVQPGDHITVTIDGSSMLVWSISIQNTTAGWTVNQTAPYLSGGSSAEWIEEAPLNAGTGGAGQADLANYGQVSFSSLTANGASVTLTTAESLAMVDGSGTVISNPSAPKAAGDAFDVCFGSASCP